MTQFPYELVEDTRLILGLIALQADETIETDFRRLLPKDVNFLVSRVASGTEVTSESLAEMEQHLTRSAELFPRGLAFDAVGYGCTSGTAQIGPKKIADLVRSGVNTSAVTEPVSALIDACKCLGIQRLAFLSPYIESVSEKLRDTLKFNGVETPVFGTFAEPEEAKVVRISTASIIAAATQLVSDVSVDGLFMSCTNLRTLDAIGPLGDELGIPVLSSNTVLAWDMLRKAGYKGEIQMGGLKNT